MEIVSYILEMKYRNLKTVGLHFNWYKNFLFFSSSFGNLFSATERIGDPLVPYVNMKYTGSEEVGPALSTMRARSSAERKNRTTDIFDGETM